MSTRSYLSIGDVLTLLRQEFPDVTISKIRFLESQGLVNPERTPSGYRKFYEHDVERLRWVLRQQREHFLPLKVIKDRLDEDANGVEPTVEAAPAAKRTPAPTAPAVEAPAVATADMSADPTAEASEPPVEEPAPEPATAEPVLVGHGASSSHRSAESGSVAADPSSALPGIESAPARSTASTATIATPAATPGTTPPAARAHRASLAAPPHRAAEAPADNSGNGTGGHAAASAATTGDKPAPRSSRAAVPAAAPDPVAEREAAPDAGSGSMDSMGGASLSLDELCAASGLSAEYVGQLQEYGLVRASLVGGIEYFDEEALTVANVAAKFAAFGIEARHLRLYKNAADREAGFIEQIVIPMVRQRNPEARARAGRTAGDLAGLGQQLKGSLLRSALRDLLNG